MPPEIQFRPETHTYTVNGQVVPSVSQVLRDMGIIKFWGTGDRAKEIGTAVHQVCDAIDADEWDGDACSDILRSYGYAYQKFKQVTGFKPLQMEERVYSEQMRLCGTLDRTGTMLGGVQITLDIKHGQIYPGYKMQVALYELMNREMNRRVADAMATLYLYDNGEYWLDPSSEADFPIARAVVSLWHWKKAKGLL